MREQATQLIETKEQRLIGIDKGVRCLSDFSDKCAICPAKFHKPKRDDFIYKAVTECAKKEVKNEKGEIVGMPSKPKNVYDYADTKKAVEKLEKFKNDPLKLMIERHRIRLNLERKNVNFREMIPSLTVMVTEACPECDAKHIYTITLEAIGEISPLFNLPVPSGMLLSEWEKEHSTERDFEIYPSDTPEKINDLIEYQSLLPIFIANPPDFESKLWQKEMKWKLTTEPGKPKIEDIKAFEENFKILLSDIAKIKTVTEKAVTAVKEAGNELQHHDAIYVFNEVTGILERSLEDKILRSLKRLLLNSIIYLDIEIARLVAAGEI